MNSLLKTRRVIVTAALLASVAYVQPATGEVLHPVQPGVSNGRILFEAWGTCYAEQCFSSENPTFDIWSMEPDGSGLTNLTNWPGIDTDGEWSPDGKKITFTSNRNGDYDIFVMDANGLNVQEIASAPGVDAYSTWSPDGRRIAYVNNTRRTHDIIVMRSDGSESRRIASFLVGQLDWLTWSPDGKWLAFSKGHRDENVRIFLIRPDGTGLRRLLGKRFGGLEASWSPDSRWLTFAGGRCALFTDPACGWDIWIVRRGGEDLRRVLTSSSGGFIAWPEWSPDGQQIVYTNSVGDSLFGGDLWVINVDGTGNRSLLRRPDSYDSNANWQPLP